MSKAKTYEDIRDYFKSKGDYIVVTTKEEFKEQTKYSKPTTICLIIQDKDKYYYNITYHNFRIKQDPFKFIKFNKFNPYTIYNIKLWCKLNNKPFELVSDIYDGNGKKLKWRCLKEECGGIFESSWADISQDHGCGICHGKQVGLSNCLATKNPELAKEWHRTFNGDLTPYDVTFCSNKEVWWQCKDNPIHVWQAKISNRKNGKGCPECSESKGEKECRKVFIKKEFVEINQTDYDNYLDNHNNNYFIPQKTFEGLRGVGNGLLSYDFYLSKYNLLVEYQGIQHEGFCKGLHKSIEDFEKQVEHDRRKKEYALSNGYNFLEVWYWDFENIEEILKKEFSKYET